MSALNTDIYHLKKKKQTCKLWDITKVDGQNLVKIDPLLPLSYSSVFFFFT